MISRITTLFRGDGLRARSLRISGLSVLVRFGADGQRLLLNLLLTRILYPEAFGLMALVNSFLMILNLLSDFGFKLSIMNHAEGKDPLFQDSIWTMGVLRGCLFVVLAIAAAYPLAAFYEEPQLAPLLIVMSLSQIVTALEPTSVTIAARELRQERVFAIRLWSLIPTAIAMLAFALIFRSPWGLVLGALAADIIRTWIMWVWVPDSQNRLRMHLQYVKDAFNFGAYIFASTLLMAIAARSERAVLGKFVSLSELGIYGVAFVMSQAPGGLMHAASQSTLLPLLRMRPPSEAAKNRSDYLKARRLILLASGSVLLCLAFLSVPIVDLLYDDRYADAGPSLLFLCLAMAPRFLEASFGSLALAEAASKRVFRTSLISSLITIPLLIPVIMRFEILGAPICLFVYNLSTYILMAVQSRGRGASDYLGDALFAGAAILVAVAAITWQWDVFAPFLSRYLL